MPQGTTSFSPVQHRRRCTAPTITTIVTEFGNLFTAMYGNVNDILVPDTGLTPLSIVAWFGFLSPILLFAVAFVKRLATAGSKK
jgi:hypothetical protein